MAGLIGRKIGMTSFFDEEGKNIPCTVIEVQPNVVTQIKTVEKDGYNAVQLAAGVRREKNTPSALKGHFEKANTTPKRILKEFKKFKESYKVGDTLDLSLFFEGEFVHVRANSKGKGFQGVVKRHGFSGVGGRTHGQHNRERAPGSIGAASFPARVFKGMKMAGRTGNDKKRVFNLRILKLYSDKNLMVISGCVPGHNGSFLTIEK